MSDVHNAVPIRFDPALEQLQPDEQETIASIDETMAAIREKTYSDGGRALRSVHAKSHGFLRGVLQVADGLAPELAQGLFAKPGRYPVLMRFSTNPGDLLDDNVSVPRGLAIKVVGVEGERLNSSQHDATQDFVLINAPAFVAPNPKKFLGSLKPLAATTDHAEGVKKALSATLQLVEKAVEAFGGKSPTVISMGGHPETHILGETYYSAAPLRWGNYVAKVALAPAAPELRALKDRKIDLDGRPNGLREEVVSFFHQQGGRWNLQAQLCCDLDAMPIEDASVQWPEDLSPYRTVATIEVEPQTAWSEALSRAIDDGVAFSPWHGLAAHRPLGAVMRARKEAYQHSARFRAERSGRTIEEPRDLDWLPR